MKRSAVAFTLMLVLPGVALAGEEKHYEGLEYFLAFLLIVCGSGAAAGNAASKKGYNYIIWFIVGLLLPVIGLWIAWVLPHKRISRDKEKEQTLVTKGKLLSEAPHAETKTCPNCGESYSPADYRPDTKVWICGNCDKPLPRN